MTTPAERAQRTVDATFREQGVDAFYTPPGGGSATPCVVIHAAPDVEMRLGDSRPALAGNIFEIRRLEPVDGERVEMTPARGGSIELDNDDGTTFVIQDDPHHAADDVFRLVWTMTAL